MLHTIGRLLRRPAAHDFRKLHLGSGKNPLPGWANLDLEGPPGTILHDLTRALPVPSAVSDFVFSEHFIEHVTRDQALALLKECHRVLKDSGVLRLSTPDLAVLVDRYAKRQLDEWHDMGWMPGTPCRLLNEGMRLWGHQFVYDAAELRLLLSEAGFDAVQAVAWRESVHPELKALECRPFHGEIILEATREPRGDPAR